jgi:hypothetical protein
MSVFITEQRLVGREVGVKNPGQVRQDIRIVLVVLIEVTVPGGICEAAQADPSLSAGGQHDHVSEH